MKTAILATALLATSLTNAAAQNAKPNVLFIVIDDLGFDDVGFRSHEINTPVIDALAKNGVVLDQYYVQDVCSPSRSTFMTGRYSMHNTIVDWIPPASAYGLPLNETTMAEKFQEAGYSCHAVGKWHLGFYKWGMTPTFRGFESFVGFYSGGEDYFKHTSGAAYDFRRDPSPNCGPGCSQVDWQDQGVYSTTVFSREAVQVVGAHNYSAKPLFLYLAYQGVHSPAEVPQSYIDPYNTSIADGKRRTFAGMLSAVDEGIGNVTSALSKAGALDYTLIIFTADNGGPTTTGDGVGARNWPLRGGKHSIWEGGTRATAFLSGSTLLNEALRAGKASSLFTGLMHGADWLPTLSVVAGYNLTGTLPLDGVVQWQAILGEAPNPRTKIVIGNSTNMCSWDISDPRHHANALPSRDGSDLPAGFYMEGSSLACGFAIKEYDGDHHWKLIKGYGGGPDTWCNSSKGGAVCGEPSSIIGNFYSSANTCSVLKGKAFPGNDLYNFSVPSLNSTDVCCAACQNLSGCVGFTINAESKSNTGPKCFLKEKMGPTTNGGSDVNSGFVGTAPPTQPGPPPEPVSTCPNGWCLYDTSADPHEEHEISAANPEIVTAMQKDLSEILQSYHQYEEDKSCPPQKFEMDPHVGKAWAPWC